MKQKAATVWCASMPALSKWSRRGISYLPVALLPALVLLALGIP